VNSKLIGQHINTSIHSACHHPTLQCCRDVLAILPGRLVLVVLVGADRLLLDKIHYKRARGDLAAYTR